MHHPKVIISAAKLFLCLMYLVLIGTRQARAQQPGTETISAFFALSAGEVAGYDGSAKSIRIFKAMGSALEQTHAISVRGLVTAMVATPQGYAFATSMEGGDRSAPIRVYTSSKDGTQQQLIYQRGGERNQVTGLAWRDSKLWIDLFESKYFTKIGYLSPNSGSSEWSLTEVAGLRMGDSFDVLGDTLVVGRSYGDEQGHDGDLMLFTRDSRVLLPSYRGVRGLTLFGDPSAPSIVMGDGWHSDYGKIAQGRVSLLRKRAGERRYSLELIDRDTSNYSFNKFYALARGGAHSLFAIGNHSLNMYRESGGDWEKKILYTQENSSRLFDAALVKDEGGRAVFAVLDGGIRTVVAE